MVEPDVDKGQVGGSEDVGREASGELVVTEVELVEITKLVDVTVDRAGEVVGVGVEDGDVGKVSDKAVEVEETAAEPSAVEVDTGESGDVQVGDGVAEVALELAVVVAHPCAGVVERVVGYVALELLGDEEDPSPVGQGSGVVGWAGGHEV